MAVSPKNAVVTGSHLDSVPDGGRLDGPLGVISGFLAIDELRARGIRPAHSIGVVGYLDEEGARFGVACLGSKLMAGKLDPETARSLTDQGGTTLAEALGDFGFDADGIGRDDYRIAALTAQIELHIEQGRQLDRVDAPVGAATAIWPHGRWSFTFEGCADHAGTAQLADRHDAALPFAVTVLAARDAADELGARATFGRFPVCPGGPNVVPGRVDALLDARAADNATLERLVEVIHATAIDAGREHGVTVTAEKLSWADGIEFDADLRDTTGKAAANADEPLVEVPTQAGHDSGVLDGEFPTAMLFVRSPHGVSHSPMESVSDDDITAGVAALARSLAEVAG